MTATANDPRFELVEEEVLGEPMLVFRNRRRRLRELLAESTVHGDREYLVEGDRRLTFAQHERAVAAVASRLAESHGIGPHDRVAILAGNCLEWVTTFWAVTSLGGVVVALNAWWSGEEIAYGIHDAEPALLVADDERLDRLAEQPPCPVLRTAELAALVEDPPPAALPDEPVDEDDAAVILYTSGTTGRPKGAVHSHRNLLGLVQVQAYVASLRPEPEGPPPPPPRIFTTSPLFHVSGLHSGVVANLAAGATTVWQSGRFDPVTVMATIERERCTSWSTVATAVWRVVHHPRVGDFDLSSMGHIGGGGSTWSPALQQRMKEVFGATLSAGVGYGLTECTGLATVAGGALLDAFPTTVGFPVPTVQVEIRDPAGEPVPYGTEGEIHIRGPLVMLGYWRNEHATSEAIRPGRWLRTGDLGQLRDGLLYLSTRRYDLILRAGENVYPVEIENVLEGHPAVAECVVVGLPHDELGQEVAAVVQLRADAAASTDELAAHVAAHLAKFKVPSRWFVVPEPLPRTATGKVIRADVLSALAAAS